MWQGSNTTPLAGMLANICRSLRHSCIALCLLGSASSTVFATPHYSDATAAGKKVLLLGDSIGAGYGLAAESAWAHGLARHLSACNIDLVNASVSGETSAGGLRRLPELLQRHQPELLIVELGGNDGLRGYPLTKLENNLLSMVQLASDIGAASYVLGMRIPPNYGPRYSNGFHDLYAKVATETDSALLPFLLQGIGDQRELMQADGIHPGADAQPLILAQVIEHLPEDFQCTAN